MGTVLLIYWILFLGVVVLWRSWIVWRQTGIVPVILNSSNSARGFVLQGLKVVSLLITLAVGIIAFAPGYYEKLAPLSYLEHTTFQYIGLAAMTFSFVWIAAAQIHMQKSFRIGIDETHNTELVTGRVPKVVEIRKGVLQNG